MTLSRRVLQVISEAPGISRAQIIAQFPEEDPKKVIKVIANNVTKGKLEQIGRSNDASFRLLQELPASRKSRGTGSTSSGNRAQQRFERAFDELMNAWIDVRNYVMAETEQAELQELREFKNGILNSLPKNKRR
jgi:hypothetical protein